MITLYLLDKFELVDIRGMTTYQPRILSLIDVGAYRDATDDAPTPPTEPNVIVAKLTITQAAFDWILESTEYGEGCVLYVEE
jgi:hypothetical protein